MSLIVGLTGGIGSGKTAVADMFHALGAVIIDTDVIAHELTLVGGAALPALQQAFGDGVIASEGGLDRKLMRQRAFSDPAVRMRLEAILHPMIFVESQRKISSKISFACECPYILFVVPLLVESKEYCDLVHRIALVDCTEKMQIARVMARSELSENEIRAIMAAQATREERLDWADDVIDNNGDWTALQRQVAHLHQQYIDIAG